MNKSNVDILQQHIENAHLRIDLLHEIVKNQSKTIRYNSWACLILALSFLVTALFK